MAHTPLRWPLRLTALAAAIILVACVTWLTTGRRQPLTKHLLVIPDFASVAEAAIASPSSMTAPRLWRRRSSSRS